MAWYHNRTAVKLETKEVDFKSLPRAPLDSLCPVCNGRGVVKNFSLRVNYYYSTLDNKFVYNGDMRTCVYCIGTGHFKRK